MSKQALSGWTAAILACAVLGMAGCGANKAAAPAGPQAVPVKVVTIQPSKVDESTQYVATLKSRDSAVLMPQVEGQITQIYVHSGDRVAAGSPIMQIDPARQQATLRTQQDMQAAKQSDVKLAQQQYERVQGLYSAQVISKQELDQAKASLDSAQAQMQASQATVRQESVQLRYYKVIAPRTGQVGDIPVRVGDRVTTSTLLTTVDQSGALEAYIYVPIEIAPRLKMNLPVQLVDSAGKVLANSRVTFISPQVDNTTQSVLAKASVANQNDALRTAQFIRARVIWGSNDQPTVPVISVNRIGGLYFVFVAEADAKGGVVAHQKAIQVGQIVGNDYVVLGGVKAGDKVVVGGTQFLVDGAPVSIQEQSAPAGT